MMLRPRARDHTAALIAKLETLSGHLVGDAEAPEGADKREGYYVVYPITGGRAYGTLGEPDSDAELIYQVTCVGSTRKQAEWLADDALELLDGFEVDGRYIPQVALEFYGGVTRDDKQTGPVFYATPRFRVITTPAADES